MSDQRKKVLALNSSPRPQGLSRTRLMLDHLVQGMEQAGAQVETVHLAKKKIKYCTGCYHCWFKSPGMCIQQDDMTRELYPKWLATDIVVYATPLYNDSMNALLKTFVERTIPSYLPTFVWENGRTNHPARSGFPAIVLLSVAGMPEMANFDLMSAHARFHFQKEGKRLLAEIYRPAAETYADPSRRQLWADILDAVRQAGQELVEQEAVSPATLARIGQPVGDPEMLCGRINKIMQICQDRGITPTELGKEIAARKKRSQ
ncbi:MAG: flavodoxin family protein [Thermodesulfobacteriota bacterium]